MSYLKKMCCLLLLACPVLLQAQYLTGISARYNDSFTEWNFYTENEDEEGELRLRWPTQNDWSEWDYRIGETFGTLKMKWKDNSGEWELRGNNKIVSARTIWNDNLGEWRITDNSKTLTLKSKWTNRWDEWLLQNSRNGNFFIYTDRELDPRDWVIEDELNEEISFEMRLMMMFIVVFNSSPKQ